MTDDALLALAERDEARQLARVVGEAVGRGGSRLVRRARVLVARRPHTRPELAAALAVGRARARDIARAAGLRWDDACGVWRVRT